ncbi:unnamed protein product [Vitrella brassicaformis CCMP3155]|uniref:NmrA-like domain-containing protein n=1 Tax=Vitrella brassicaformis (strain CCMP3155) TaxID=1169540 RepID=A0A0G4FIU6_VITBC|nr:unnamed protein product [Vitrella brassicaformis CCMP3155]|eukprot:CEM13217.1 unnamed protein product [Vitrella brassicaformis CCMP3155]
MFLKRGSSFPILLSLLPLAMSFTPSKRIFAITGCTGRTGGEVLKELVKQRQLANADWEIRALVRNRRGHRADWMDQLPGVKVVLADMKDRKALRDALRGCTEAFLVCGNTAKEGEQTANEENFIECAKEEGVKYLVKAGTADPIYGTDAPVAYGREHTHIEGFLRSSGVPFTVLHPCFYMQNHLIDISTITKERCIYDCTRASKAGWIDIRDVAECAVRLLIMPEEERQQHVGATYEITGPELLDFQLIAKVYSEVLDTPISVRDMTPREWAHAHFGNPDAAVADMMQIWRDGHFATMTTDEGLLKVLQPHRTFRQWVQENAGLYKGGGKHE